MVQNDVVVKFHEAIRQAEPKPAVGYALMTKQIYMVLRKMSIIKPDFFRDFTAANFDAKCGGNKVIRGLSYEVNKRDIGSPFAVKTD